MLPVGLRGVDSVVSAALSPGYFFVRFEGRLPLLPFLINHRALFTMKLVESIALEFLSGNFRLALLEVFSRRLSSSSICDSG
jgi:hypothetical protein